MNGKVYLVGAGPGASGLITVRGMELIRLADVIVYDRLIGQQIMDMLPEYAEKIDVGKNAGNHPVPQQEINALLVDRAKAGKTVVRLKGGDPFVFGRGGEELELLAAEGIAFEEVPGISSSIAVPAYAGIPVTHRDYCSSLHIITGHAQAGKKLQIDFDALVRLNGTLVFMMGVSNVGQIATGLMGAGMDPKMPCAVIENGTLPGQRKFVTVLEELEETVRSNAVHSPAVIMVGRVCDLSVQFDWFNAGPLKGRRILVTQPEARSSRLVEGLRKLGADVVLYPCIRTTPIRPLRAENIGVHDTLVFTSVMGVRSWCDWLLEQGKDMRALAGMKIAVIGSATGSALRKYGLQADFMPSEYSGEALGKEMIESGFADQSNRVLLLRTKATSHNVTDALAKAQIPYTDLPVYETELIHQPQRCDLKDIDAVTFTSRSCVEGFVQSQGNCGGKPTFAGVRALCIGRQTADAAKEYGFDIIVSETATIESMIAKAEQIFTE